MIRSRRAFVAEAAMLTAAGGTRLTSRALATDHQDSVEDEAAEAFCRVYSIGKVEKEGGSTRIRIFDEYADGLLGLDQWSHVNVFYW